jgi:hypothetical protein
MHGDGDLIEMVSRLGGLGGHQLLHGIDRPRGDLARRAPGNLSLGQPHAQGRWRDEGFAVALDGIRQRPAVCQGYRNLSIR